MEVMDIDEFASRSPPPPRGDERATEELIERMKSKGRDLQIAVEGTEELRFLNFMSANANVGGELMTNILLRIEPRVIEVWEEFLHGTQKRCGIIEKLGVYQAEIHVKKFMLRHRRLIGISDGDVRILEALMEGSLR
jgi:hypothetical protein